MNETEVDLEILQRCGVNVSRFNKSSKSAMVSCPWHEDKSPSCSVSFEKHIYHCFSCGKSGTLNNLYYEKFGHSIKKDLGIGFSFTPNKSLFTINTPISYEDVPDTHVNFSGHIVPVTASNEAQSYLKKRGIPISVASEMKMQYAINALAKDGANVDDKSKWIYVTNRLVIPIYEKRKLLSIECRDTLGKKRFEEMMKEKGIEARYKKVLYPFASSTSTLFQYEHLDTDKPLYFVEGLMDLGVLRSDSFFKNSTAVFGASIGNRQQYLLKKFKELIYIADHDKAGLISIYQLKESLGREFKYVFAPKGAKDVGDIPQVLNLTVEECRNRNWLSMMKSSDDFDIINEAKKSEFVTNEDFDIISKAYGGKK